MRRLAYFLLLSVFFLVFYTDARVCIGQTANGKLARFEKMQWLLGRWKSGVSDLLLQENWSRTSDTVFSGTSLLLALNDTLYYESIRIAPNRSNIFYVVTSRNDGKTETISYRQMKCSAKKLVFENSSVKELSRITYMNKKGEYLLLKLEGSDDDEKSCEIYKLLRAE
jgi:hypothetical protein